MSNLFKKVVSSVALLAMIFALVPTASFAATISEGDLVKASGSSAVYLIQDGKKRVFPHSSVYLSWGYPANYSTVKTVSADELSAYPDGDPVIYRDGFMFRFHGVGMVGGYDPSAVFYVSDGKIRPIESVTAYMKLFNGGVNESSAWDRVYWIPDDLLAKFTYPQGDKITASQIDLGQLPNGLVVRDTNSKYYVIKNGQLANITSDALAANRYTANANVFTKMLVTKLANSVLNLMPAGPAITAADPDLLTVKKISAQPSTTNVVLSSDKTSVEADGASYATLTALVPSTVTAVNFVITSGSGMLSAYTVTPVNGVATVRVTPSASSVSGTLTVTASATGLTSASVTLTTVANTLAPQVVSVSNQGMRLINVVFDKAVDKSSAETPTNYTPKNNKGTTVYDPSVSKAKLMDDGRTVQLFVPSGFYNDSIEDSIEIKNVQNVAQTATMSTVTKLLTVTDTSVPTVVAVEALGSKALRVTFSEAVLSNWTSTLSAAGTGIFDGITFTTGVPTSGTYNAFRLDDKTLNDNGTACTSTTSCIDNVIITYPDAGDYTKALIRFANPISVGAHSLMVSYNGLIKDYNTTTTDGNAANPYIMQPANYVVTVVADTTVPTLSSVEVLTQTKVRYTFSKPVDLDTATDGATKFFWSTAANQTSGTFAQAAITKVSDTVYEVSWGSAIATGNIYFYAGTAAAPIRDFSGNSISPVPSSQMAVVVADTAPSISSVSMDTNSDRVVLVYFNKDVEEASAETISNYVFKDASGNILTSTTGGNGIGSNGNPVAAPVRDDTNYKKVKITLGDSTQDANALPGGSYQLTVSNVKALGGTTAMSSQSYPFTVTDKTRPTLYSTTNAFANNVNYFASPHRLVLKFSEPMGASAVSASSYEIRGNSSGVATHATNWTKLSDISGVSLSFRNSNKDVVIDFPTTETLANGATDFKIGYIDGSTTYAPTDADVAGNIFNAKDAGLNSSLEGSNITVTSAQMDLDKDVHTAITSMKITSATTIDITFATEIDAISASEFKIKNTANASGMVPTNAVINSSDKKVVTFTIPSGSSYEFTSSDAAASVGITLSNNATETTTTKDILGLTLKTTNANDWTVGNTAGNTFKNDIKPNMKAVSFVAPSTVYVTFDGQIQYSVANMSALANILKVTGTVGTTQTTQTGSQLTVTTVPANTSSKQIKVVVASPITSDSIIVNTVSQSSIDAAGAVGANGATIAENLTGKTNSGLVAANITLGKAKAGYSQGGVVSAALAAADTNFNISYNGGAMTAVATANMSAMTGTEIAAELQSKIRAALGVGNNVTVSCDNTGLTGDGCANAISATSQARFTVTSDTKGVGSSIVITSAASNDVASKLALGLANGGSEYTGVTAGLTTDDGILNADDAILIEFSKAVSTNSISSNTWTNNMITNISNLGVFDTTTEKITFASGYNIGEILTPGLDIANTANTASIQVSGKYLLIQFTAVTGNTTIASGLSGYTPSSSITSTDTTPVSIDANFVAQTNSRF